MKSIILLVAALLYLTISTHCLEENRRTIDESYNYVSKECDNNLRQIDSLAKFSEFVYHYKFLIKGYKKPKKGILNSAKHLRHCYDEEEPILELERIINDRQQGVCNKSYVERLVEYHSKYMAKDETNNDNNDEIESPSIPKSSYIKFFFTVYANQVAYTCKSKISTAIKDLQSKKDCSTVLAKAFPQIFAARTNQPLNTEVAGQVSDLNNFLDSFDRVENFVPVMKYKNIKTPQGYYDVLIPDEAVQKINDLRKECKLREPDYTALFSPVGALAQLGYIVDGPEIDANNNESDKKLLKCWLATAQLCQGILRTRLTLNRAKEIDPDLKSKLVTIKWGSPKLETDRLIVENNSSSSENEAIELSGSFEEILPSIVKQVKKKYTIKEKVRSKVSSVLSKFVLNRIDMDAIQQEAEKNFIDTLTDTDNGIDSKVAFNGKKFNDKKFNPASIVCNHADAAVKMSSSFWSKEIGLIFSSIVAIVMSGVFVWFSLYALASVIKQHYFSSKDDGNFKQQYLELRKKQIDKINNKKTGIFKFYKPS